MKIMNMPRRAVLRGATGFTLALPFLSSINGGRALGDVLYQGPKRLFAFRTDHGAVRPDYLFPPSTQLTERVQLYPGHEVARGRLVRTVDGASASVSRWLRASSVALTDRLVGKLNVLQGLDIPWYCGHNQGSMLGNYTASVTKNPLAAAASLDNVLAWSGKFYGATAALKQRVTVFGHPGSPSFTWAQPSLRTGGIVHNPPTAYTAKDLFHRLFDGTGATPTGQPPRKPVVDRVIADFKRLRDGNRRLSRLDKQKLEAHIDRLAELDRSLNARATSPKCQGLPEAPNKDLREGAGLIALVDVAAAAFTCGVSQIFVGHSYDTPPFDGFPDWHSVAHKSWVDPANEEKMLEHHRWIFENLFLALASKLDASEEASGRTYLDNALMMLSMECGPHTHEDQSVPIVTAGAAGGTMRTGYHCDYRNLAPTSLRQFDKGEGFPQLYTGLTHNQWLATAGQALGLNRADFELNGQPGFGGMNVDAAYRKTYVRGVTENASDWLPFLRA